jgi:hypothetical protein
MAAPAGGQVFNECQPGIEVVPQPPATPMPRKPVPEKEVPVDAL